MPEELIPLVVVPSLFLLIGIIYWMANRSAERRAQLRYELSARTLERFTTADEMSKFFETDAGRVFLRILERGEQDPADRALRSLKIGVVACCFGLGFVLLSIVMAEGELVYPGVIFLSLGLGFVAAFVVARKLREANTESGALHELSRSPYRDAA